MRHELQEVNAGRARNVSEFSVPEDSSLFGLYVALIVVSGLFVTVSVVVACYLTNAPCNFFKYITSAQRQPARADDADENGEGQQA